MESISVEKIKILRNIRTEIGDLSELMGSIRENGLLEPIGVKKEKEEYILIYGHRRFLALKKLGRKELIINKEVLIKDDCNDEDLLVLNLIENYHRQENSPLEFAKVCSDLRELGLSLNEIAIRLSAPKTKIITSLNLLSYVPSDYKNKVTYMYNNKNKKGNLSPTIAESILHLRRKARLTKEDIEKLFEYARKEQLSVRELRIVSLLLQSGCDIDNAILLRGDYINTGVELVINKKELKKLNTKIIKYIITLIEKDNKYLLFRKK